MFAQTYARSKSRPQTRPAVAVAAPKKPAESNLIQRASDVLNIFPIGQPNTLCDGPKAFLYTTIHNSIIPFCFFQTGYWAVFIGGLRDFRRIGKTGQTDGQTRTDHSRSN